MEERKEKLWTRRDAAYFKDLIKKMRDEAGEIVNAHQLVTRLLSEKDGGVVSGYANIARIRLDIKKMLGDYLEVITEGTSQFWYLDKNKISEQDLLNRVDDYFRKNSKTPVKTKEKPKKTFHSFTELKRLEEERMETSGITSLDEKPKKVSRYHKKTLKNLLRFCKLMMKFRGQCELLDLDFDREPELKAFIYKYNGYMRDLKVMSDLNKAYKNGKWYITVTKIEDALIGVNNKLKELYGEGENITDLIGRKVMSTSLKPVDITPQELRPKLEKFDENDDYEEKDHETKIDDSEMGYVIWCMASLLELSSKQKLDIDVLSRAMREHYNIYVGTKDILDIAKSYSGWFEYNNIQRFIRIKELTIGRIRKECGPENHKFTFLARISMSVLEVKKYFENDVEIEIESEISDRDNIYSITINRKLINWKNLIHLYRTFRGVDKILGNQELVEKLEKEIKILEAREMGEIKAQLLRLENGEML